MKHKNAEVLIALAEGKQIEWSLDERTWYVYDAAVNKTNPVTWTHIHWRVYAPPPIPVDTPVWVRDQPTHQWKPRHAAEPGHAWADGCTSHSTASQDSTPWRYITTERPASLNSETTES
jgi:hypothetical protein